jgi:tetratricopeptide (TPR) repeat protein
MLITYMRFQGSVANRLPEEAMAELRRDARAVAAHVTDERTLADYFAAEGFFLYWVQGAGRPVTEAEIAAANASAERALDIGRRLDDWNLQSTALDALAGVASTIQNKWRTSRVYSLQRLSFQDRLELSEKVDAHAMVVWSSVLLGELDEAERVSAEGIAQVQPGQVPAITLHLVVWRIYTLTLLGRWDEALTMAERARQLWIEVGRSSTGYALRGFMSAIDVARARKDEGLMALYGAIHDEISAAFPEGTPLRRWIGYGNSDLRSCQEAVEYFLLHPLVHIERLERGLSMLLDHDRIPSTAGLLSVRAFCGEREYPLVEAQVERALGRAQRDLSRLDRSIALFDRAGAIPYAARVRCERALIAGDRAEMRAGLQVLERLGDADQVGRFERLQVG